MDKASNSQVSKFSRAGFLSALGMAAALADQPVSPGGPAPAVEHDYSFAETITESLTGDVYSDPSKWQELSYGDLFTKGWDQPWTSPPTGGGGAPRQGWLNAYEGVFYRLGIAVLGWQHDLAGVSDGTTGSLTVFTPLSQRFEFQTDIPMVVSNRRAAGLEVENHFGDFQVTPRIMLSESRNLTQTFNITFRTPTGVNSNLGTNIAALTPNYQFWANWWQGLVVRGGASSSPMPVAFGPAARAASSTPTWPWVITSRRTTSPPSATWSGTFPPT